MTRDTRGWRFAVVLWPLFAAMICTFTTQRALAQSGIPCRYLVSHIIEAPPGTPPFEIPTTVATGISPSGRYVCGYYTYVIDRYAFLYDTQTNQFTTLPYPPSTFTFANDVNEEYVVGQGEGLGFLFHIATRQSMLLYPLVDPSVGTCSVNAINSSNLVCGTRTMQVSPNTRTTAFRWSAKSGFEDLGLINGQNTTAADIANDNTVVGRMNISNVLRPFLWDQPGNLTDLGTLFGFSTTSNGMNNNHEVIGASNSQQFPPTHSRAFLWERASMQNLGVLPGFNQSSASDISDDGWVIGQCAIEEQSGATAPFIWIDGRMNNLNSIMISADGSTVKLPLAISQGGRIAGQGRDAQGNTVGIVLDPILSPTADINHDCRVGVPDLLAVINEWGQLNSQADINDDQSVNIQDLMIVIRDWTFD